jgi:hypothetical protein
VLEPDLRNDSQGVLTQKKLGRDLETIDKFLEENDMDARHLDGDGLDRAGCQVRSVFG